MTLVNRKGFLLPTVIFAVTIMSGIAVVTLSTASDERRTSRASRESTLAMYAAEAGLRQTYGAWPVVAAQALEPGDSLDLGWQSLPNKAAFRTVIHRVDSGGLTKVRSQFSENFMTRYLNWRKNRRSFSKNNRRSFTP